jgi:diguanylate cyclase (GGDEF)-like protein
MQESLERELSRATRKKSTVGLMMLDVDHFKHFNDTFGHEAGDTVLRTLGSILKTQFRGEDVACRYGGEEFTVILPEASIESTHQRAEQLRERVRKEIAELHDQPIAPVSLSIGVSIFPTDGASGETLLRAADAALYQAKAQGRDRVVIA